MDGVDVRRVSQHDLREKIGYVPQKGSLFTGTIASNLQYAKEDATTADMEEAASIAQALDFIDEKQERFDAPIAQGGTNVSGGQRQRIGVARALSLNPQFIVCDEPVSALDVSIQAQILNLLQDLQEERGLTYMFITHDMSVVKHISDDIAVMYLGQMIEKCPASEIFKNTIHPYSKALLSAIPIPKVNYKHERMVLKGEIVSPIDPKVCCRFAARCPYAKQECRETEPELREIKPDHMVACHRAEEFMK